MNMGTDGGDERWLTRRCVTKKMRKEQAIHRLLPGTCKRRQMILTARNDKELFAERIEIKR
jgi:hypothetical protein